MQIKKKSQELDKKTIFRMTESDSTVKMSDADGQVLEIAAWILYDDVNGKGEQVEVLSILTTEGEIYATISDTFKKKFSKMVDVFGSELDKIKIVSGTSKKGLGYISCDVV